MLFGRVLWPWVSDLGDGAATSFKKVYIRLVLFAGRPRCRCACMIGAIRPNSHAFKLKVLDHTFPAWPHMVRLTQGALHAFACQLQLSMPARFCHQ